MAQIILYADANFGGQHTHLFETTPDFAQLHIADAHTMPDDELTWDDRVSSFVIVGGVWQFFKDTNFKIPQGNPGGLGPGLYRWVEAVGIDNDSLSSVRLIKE
ncbi:MAG TPA: beta/gamma crystallin-related protein [Stellaceae bacterium]|nr:beta/gamma crystallin-related protein [Stellaceae bacterium]